MQFTLQNRIEKESVWIKLRRIGLHVRNSMQSLVPILDSHTIELKLLKLNIDAFTLTLVPAPAHWTGEFDYTTT